MKTPLTDDQVRDLPLDLVRARLREDILATPTARRSSRRTTAWTAGLAAAAITGAAAGRGIWRAPKTLAVLAMGAAAAAGTSASRVSMRCMRDGAGFSDSSSQRNRLLPNTSSFFW